MSDVKVQQLAFLCERQLFAQGLRGFHDESFRFAYGASRQDLGNDLLALRKKERLENFDLTDKAGEAVDVSTLSEPDSRLPIRAISFHSTLRETHT